MFPLPKNLELQNLQSRLAWLDPPPHSTFCWCEATCPYHKLSDRSGCKKLVTIKSPGGPEQRELALHRLLYWCSQAQDHDHHKQATSCAHRRRARSRSRPEATLGRWCLTGRASKEEGEGDSIGHLFLRQGGFCTITVSSYSLHRIDKSSLEASCSSLHGGSLSKFRDLVTFGTLRHVHFG